MDKLSSPWEGPYIVDKVVRTGTYKIANREGEELMNAWKTTHTSASFTFRVCTGQVPLVYKIKVLVSFPLFCKFSHVCLFFFSLRNLWLGYLLEDHPDKRILKV